MISRAKRTLFSEWWWTVDRLMIGAVLALILIGIVLLLAASPPVAIRLGLDPFYFVHRQALFLLPALLVLFATSLLSPRQVRRVALIVFILSLALVAATLVIGPEIKGARRWLNIFGVSLQPSEFLKPAFVVLAAWAFSESGRRPEMPATFSAFVLLLLPMLLLVQQPDFGQTVLLVLIWGALFFLAGLRWIWTIGLGSTAAIGVFAAYHLIPHVASRFQRFLNRGSGDTFQMDTSLESFMRGGWFGRGPGEGTVKRILPDGHTDFIFAVAAEEFGLILCLILLGLFAFIVLRSLAHALREEDAFARLAIAGLALLFGLQSAIAMAVSLYLIPAKGMTLPFVSYGGSSLISLAFGIGMLIALTRKRSRAESLAEIEHAAARESLERAPA
ncbi:MAG TPA: putative peptidoglycan glycosyltransferase FtsW [Xanthobacteraceae bacterium]|nr:putative peptidoglycan glycosyltransferase FtsW [Xanthobacteraceae bacterium]